MLRTFLILLTLLFTSTLNAHAQVLNYNMDEVWRTYDSFNEEFLDTEKGIYKVDTSFDRATDRWNGAAAIWCQPMFWDMAINAHQLALKTKDKPRAKQYKELVEKIYQGEKSHYTGFDFDDNNENTGWFIYDDIMWWTIALSRAYLITETTSTSCKPKRASSVFGMALCAWVTQAPTTTSREVCSGAGIQYKIPSQTAHQMARWHA